MDQDFVSMAGSLAPDNRPVISGSLAVLWRRGPGRFSLVGAAFMNIPLPFSPPVVVKNPKGSPLSFRIQNNPRSFESALVPEILRKILKDPGQDILRFRIPDPEVRRLECGRESTAFKSRKGRPHRVGLCSRNHDDQIPP